MQIICVLDWELTTLGDPLMDLGNSLAYWIEAGDPAPVQLMRRQPSHAPGMLTRREFVDYYAERAGIRIDNFDFYYTYGLFRLRSEEHTSELQSLMRISYGVFCL